MGKGDLYEEYHRKSKLQKKVISENNFTYRNLISLLKPHIRKSRWILDIGCGTGTISFYLAKKGKDVVGLDVSLNAIKIAKKNAALLGLAENVQFFRRNFPNQVPKRKYDLIICSELLEHLEDDQLAVRKIYQLLKGGGVMVISVPSKNAPLYKLGLLVKFDKRVGHLRRYEERELIHILKHAGLKVIGVRKTEGIIRNFLFTNNIAGQLIRFIKGPVADIVTFLDNLTIPIFGESQICLVTKK